MGKFRVAVLAVCLVLAGGALILRGKTETRTYPASKEIFANAMMGYAPDVRSDKTDGTTLRYLGLSWREWEPEEGVYDVDGLEETYHLRELREQGVHLVLRFLCDTPGSEEHLDIPDWLYEKTADGSWYDTSYGKGYSPDYANETFRLAHRKAIAALAETLDDGFAAYVELGSLGHWGEWHIKSGEGLVPMPGESIRDSYVQDYMDYFQNAKLLMRRPFAVAAQNSLGLYNDMTGMSEDTEKWLDWAENGGWYGEEENALQPMPHFWQNAPVGGEFTSSLSMQTMLQDELANTISLLEQSHMTFLGPKAADPGYAEGYTAVLGAMGYRLRVASAQKRSGALGVNVSMELANDGAAPFYWDWPIVLYAEDDSGNELGQAELAISLSALQPGSRVSAAVKLPAKTRKIYLGIQDPMTGQNAVRFAMEGQTDSLKLRLF